MSKNRNLNEAGSYDNLTAQEKQFLSKMRAQTPEVAANVASLMSTFRQRGKQIDLINAARQLQAMPQYKSDPSLNKFIAAASFGAHTLTKGKTNVPAPPAALTQQMLPPKQVGPTPAEKFEQIRTNPTMSNDEQIAAQKMNPLQQQVQKRQMARAKQQQVNPFGKTDPNIAEAVNPAMMANELKQIQTLLSRVKPQHLMVVAQMVDALMKGQRPGTQMENRKVEIIKKRLIEQIETRNTADKLLSEGPIANVWDRIKGAGTAIGQKMGMGDQAQMSQAVGANENQKKAAQEMTKLIGKVNQQRQKFNSSILKNSEGLHAYHDTVLAAVQMYQQYQQVLGPFGQQIIRQIYDAIGNLVHDLNSEKSQIDTFLTQLKDAGVQTKAAGGSAMIKKGSNLDVDLDTLGAQAEERNKQRLAQENPGAVPQHKRLMPYAGQGVNQNYSDQLDKSQAFAKHQAGKEFNDPRTQQSAMNDLQKLYAKQIERSGKGKSKSRSKTKSKKRTKKK